MYINKLIIRKVAAAAWKQAPVSVDIILDENVPPEILEEIKHPHMRANLIATYTRILDEVAGNKPLTKNVSTLYSRLDRLAETIENLEECANKKQILDKIKHAKAKYEANPVLKRIEEIARNNVVVDADSILAADVSPKILVSFFYNNKAIFEKLIAAYTQILDEVSDNNPLPENFTRLSTRLDQLANTIKELDGYGEKNQVLYEIQTARTKYEKNRFGNLEGALEMDSVITNSNYLPKRVPSY